MRKPRTTASASPPADRPHLVPLGYLLRQAAGAHRLRMERVLADLEVTPPQMLVLTTLARHPGLSSADLARETALTAPTISVIVANLLRRGALDRRPHAVHGRVRHLDLTALGHELLAACRLRARTVERDLMRAMSPSDIAIIGDWLRRAARHDGEDPDSLERDDGAA